MKTAVSIIWKFAICAVASVGVLMQTGIIGGGILNLGTLNYFTVLSNLLVAFYFLVDAVWMLNHLGKAKRGGEWQIKFKHAVLMCIVLTGVIANTLIAGQFSNQTGAMATSMMLLHICTPVMAVLDWILFERKGQIRPGEPFVWMVLPLLYFAYVMVAVGVFGFDFSPLQTGSRYPYPFIDLDALGIQQLLANVGLIAVAFLIVGYVVFVVDRMWAFIAKKRTAKPTAKGSGKNAAGSETKTSSENETEPEAKA